MTDKNDKPVVNFVVLQSVEDYVEKSGRFRTECASFKIPGRDSGGASTVYIRSRGGQTLEHKRRKLRRVSKPRRPHHHLTAYTDATLRPRREHRRTICRISRSARSPDNRTARR
jgi:hypothetical protein